MATIAELKAQGSILRRDLEAIEADLLKANTALQQAVSNPDMDANAAGVIAGRVALLEARKVATAKAIEANGRELVRAEQLINSKEYKQAQKRIAEIEKQFSTEAVEVRAALMALRDRVVKALDVRPEYVELLNQYAVELSQDERRARVNSADIRYLTTAFHILESEAARLQTVESLDGMTRRLIAARRNPKPASKPAASEPLRTFFRFRQTNSDGTPIQ